MTAKARKQSDGDGNLPAALKRLTDAVSALTDPIPAVYGDHHNTWLDPLYTQLVDSIAGQTGERSGSRTSVPLWLDCHDLRAEIDTAVTCWQADGDSTPDRLHRLEQRKWRPQDVRGIDQISANLESWVHAITALLNPIAVKTISAPCPACGATHVYRPYAGEMVRQAALHITVDGCSCQRCKTVWTPDYFTHLARVIGCGAPDGVLE